MNLQTHSKPKQSPVPSGFPKGPLLRALAAMATHAYNPRDVLELTLTYNQRLRILEAQGDWWYIARTMSGVEGWVPSSYVKLLATPQSLDMNNMYRTWTAKTIEAFRPPAKGEKKEKLDKRTFPWLPPEVCACEEPSCWLRKQDMQLGACIHDVELLLRGAGEGVNCAAWLWRQSLLWHPDRFVKRLKESFREEGMKAVSEMFTILTEMSQKQRERENEEQEQGGVKIVG